MSSSIQCDVKDIFNDLIGKKFRLELGPDIYLDDGNVTEFEMANIERIGDEFNIKIINRYTDIPNINDVFDYIVHNHQSETHDVYYYIEWKLPFVSPECTIGYNIKFIIDYLINLGAYSVILHFQKDEDEDGDIIEIILRPSLIFISHDHAISIDEYVQDDILCINITAMFKFNDLIKGG